MQIVSSAIKMQVQHQFQQSTTQRESLALRAGPTTAPGTQDQISLSPEALNAAAAPTETGSDGLTPRDKLAVDILRHLFKAITGHDMVLHTPKLQRQSQGGTTTASPQPATNSSATGAPPSAGFGLAYDATSTYQESESVSFQAEGILKTADGQELQFSVQLNLSRSFTETQSTRLRLGDPVQVDPLVVNYGGNAAELGSTKFAFDLDSDGNSEQISNLKPGSALLALDQNGNGQIDNGKELFGPSSGNGFQELARYDQDGNNFIDANDPVYNKLRLWMRDDAGNSQLVGLGQAGIGAIYLGSQNTQFQYKDAGNQSLGQLTSTGLFFREDGGVGTVQQIDYSV